MLYKRSGTENWSYKFVVDGKTIRRTTGTSDKAKAEEIAAKAYAGYFDQKRLGVKPRYLWQQAVIRYLQESGHKKSLETDKIHLRWMAAKLDGVYLDEINTDKVEELIKAKLKVSGQARCNRMTAMLSTVLQKAKKEWGWLDSTPYIRRFKESAGRLRWLTHDEADMILAALPEHTRDMAEFSLATGLREANVTHLEWSQVNLQTRILWIYGDQFKNGKTHRIPLNSDAIAVLRRQIGKHPKRVFTYRGEPVNKAGTGNWRSIVRGLGFDDVTWHTLRHTWASWHVQAGTTLDRLQELGGWETYDMVRRYAHLRPEHLAEDAARVNRGVKSEIKLKVVKK